MIVIKNGQNIEYTKDDTFELFVEAEDAIDGSVLNFAIAKDESFENLVEKQFSLSEDGFMIVLDSSDKALLDVDNYLYKMAVISPAGKKITQLSGNFKVKWGA